MRNVDHVHALVADACVYVDVRLRMITQRHNFMSSTVLSTLFFIRVKSALRWISQQKIWNGCSFPSILIKSFTTFLLQDGERCRIFLGRGKKSNDEGKDDDSPAELVLFYCCLLMFNGRPLWTYLSEAKFDDKKDRWLSCLWAICDWNGKEIISSPRQNRLVEYHYWLILNRIKNRSSW